MSKDSRVTAEVAAASPILMSVQFVKELRIFGRPLNSVSANMTDLKIAWDGSKVIVKQDGDDAVEWVLPQAIASLRFR